MNRLLKLICVICISVIFSGCGDESENSSSHDEQKDYYTLNDEFEEIGNIIDDHDIVIIGESTHWSADIADKKMDLIEYLADEHDFNLLFLETGDAEFNYYRESGLPAEDGAGEMYRQERFSEVLNGENENLQAAAMDWTPGFEHGSITAVSVLEENIVNEINEFNTGLAEDFKRSEYALRDWFSRGLFNMQDTGYFDESSNPSDVHQNIRNEAFFNDLSEASQNYIIQKDENIKNYFSQFSFDGKTTDYYEYRAIGMSDKVLSQMTDDDKALVWTANGHAEYDVTQAEYLDEVYINEGWNERENTLGSFLKDSEYKVYNIGLFHNEADGYKQAQESYETPRVTDDDTLEGNIGNRVQEDIFIDLKTSSFIDEREYTAFNYGYYEYNMVPQEQFDGIIYIDHVEE